VIRSVPSFRRTTLGSILPTASANALPGSGPLAITVAFTKPEDATLTGIQQHFRPTTASARSVSVATPS
jgi:hypothetical protein